MSGEDVFDSFEPVLRDHYRSDNPWIVGDLGPRYQPDYNLLAKLLAVPIGAGSGSETGRLASAIDAWAASELRRAGFPPDEVWPRSSRPRVLPRELGLFVDSLPRKLRDELRPRLASAPAIAPRDAKILGRAFFKQVDVVIAQWSRGPELMISTKSMVSSFGNNLKNRFEESYGDAKNLRGRYPLAAIGFLFVFRSTILDHPDRFEAAVDMLRKLKAEEDVYDTTCMVVAEWEDPEPGGVEFCGVRIRNDATPVDLQAAVFLGTLVETVLDRTPIGVHVNVRELHEHRVLPIRELDESE